MTGAVNMQSDGSNREKALLDAAVAAKVLPDDSLKYVGSGHWRFAPSDGEATVTVWFEPMGEVVQTQDRPTC